MAQYIQGDIPMNARRITLVVLYVALIAAMFIAGKTVPSVVDAASLAPVENVPNPCYKWQDVSPFSVIDGRRMRQAHCEPIGSPVQELDVEPTDLPNTSTPVVTVTATPVTPTTTDEPGTSTPTSTPVPPTTTPVPPTTGTPVVTETPEITETPVVETPTQVVTEEPTQPPSTPVPTEEPDRQNCNKGEGNGSEGCDPGNHPENGNNDEDDANNGPDNGNGGGNGNGNGNGNNPAQG